MCRGGTPRIRLNPEGSGALGGMSDAIWAGFDDAEVLALADWLLAPEDGAGECTSRVFAQSGTRHPPRCMHVSRGCRGGSERALQGRGLVHL